jgi:hypothetical protein
MSAPLGDRCYFLLLVDDASQFMWVILPMKLTATDTIKHVQVAAEKESGLKLQVLCTDNGGEFTAIKFAAYCIDEGI